MHVPLACLVILYFLSASCQTRNRGTTDPITSRINLPSGFHIEKYAEGVKGAREMTLGENNTIFVGTRGGQVFALEDKNLDYKVDNVLVIASGLNSPNGVAFKNGDLYVGEIHRIIKFEDIENQLDNIPKPIIIFDEYPDKSHHGYKYIAFGPDGKLYVPVGAPCNVCEKENPVFASITRINDDGSNFEIIAKGVRNSVGFDWHPITNELWFTDNGRDMLGDDIPHDELNRISKIGQHFGFPYCHQGDLLDPDFGDNRNCNDYQAPVQKLNPHGASLGMLFYTGEMFPKEYKNQILLCEHGSWNRSKKIGYQVSLVNLNENKATSFSVFANGWLMDNEDILGKPVALLQLSDGSVLLSDDYSGIIYRITYVSEK